MVVEFRLLGAVEVSLDGRQVDVGHVRQQCVLAALAIEVNRPVPAERLIDRVWGEQQPQRALITLQSYLSRLRKVLAGGAGPGTEAEGVTIARRSGGYLLAAEPASVDVYTFRQLVAQARLLLRAGTAEGRTSTETDTQAAALLARALGLWRGEALESLDTPWLNAMREALDHERVAAVLDHNDIALRLGRHAELVADLTGAAAASPLDERIASQAMLALYRCGRQADALETYRLLRLRLVDELGTDPSPPLRQLYHQILAADPELAAPEPVRPAGPPAGGTRPGPVPRQLPASPVVFTGRTAELAELHAIVEGTAVPVVVISGGGGIGKTWLALNWANRQADRYPDGQLYVNLRGYDPTSDPVDPGVALRGFLEALGVEPARIPTGVDAQASLYRSLTAGRRMLVVLDNAHDTDAVVPLLPGTSAGAVLVTSRRQLTGLLVRHGARSLTLDVMPGQEARALLARHLGPRRAAGEEEAVAALVSHCAGLPLALGIAAARAVARPELSLSTLAVELRTATTRLDALDGGELAVNLRAVLSCSVRALGGAAARVFALLGLAHGPDISLAAAASLAGLDLAGTRSVLDQLAAANLVHQHTTARYRMHDLVRLYAVEQSGEDPDGVLRLLDHYLHTAHRAALLLSPHRNPLPLDPPHPGTVVTEPADLDSAMGWFATEHPVLLATIRQADEGRFNLHANRIPWTLATYFDRRGHWEDWVLVQRIAVDAAQRLADRPAQAQARRLLANAYSNLRRYDEAHAQLRDALRLLDEDGPAVEAAKTEDTRAHVHFDLALLFDRQGQPGQALPHAEHSLACYQAAGNELGEAVARNAIGWYHCELGQYSQAIEHCMHALALAEKTGSQYGQANTWDSIGYAHHHLGQYPEATDAYHHAIDLFRDIGDRHAEAITLGHLGDTSEAAGEPVRARELWRQALDTLDELEHPDADQLRAKLAS
jgi:DNA-binding SARP family transcriptional activator/tetratricopeptide (TPR) repeat protein